MNTAINYQEPEADRGRDPRRDLSFPRALPRLENDCLRGAETIQARIDYEARLVMHCDPYSMAADRFRMLRMHLRALARTTGVKVLMVTSALPREGKTAVSLNLAIGLAERAGNKVVLVETDLRHPMLASRLGLEQECGLVQCLETGTDPLSALRRVNPLGIYMLTAGKIASNPIELLNSESFAKTITQLRSAADWIVLDAPPAVPVPDVLDIRANADACIWVMRAHETPREMVRDAIYQFGPDKVAGIVLNESNDLDKSYTHYYDARTPLLLSAGE